MAKNNQELLVDTFAIRFNLCEDRGNKLVGKGVFARAGFPTANRRIYPESVWRKNINKLQKEIKERKILMACDHPEHGKSKLAEAAAVLTDLRVESNGDIIGEMEIIPGTPNGAILSALVDANCTIGVSSRGYGSVKMNESGQDVVQNDYVLMTFDAVSDPANATSWPEFNKEGGAEESVNTDEKKVITEIEKKESNMAENEQKPISPKKAAEELPVVSSPNPTEPPQTAKKYYGIFQKTGGKEYASSTAKFIFTDKEDAAEMAKQMGADSQDKTSFEVKEMDYSEILKTESTDTFKTEEEEKVLDAEGAEEFRKVLAQMEDDNQKLTLVAKEMAYRFFLEKNLSHHPKYSEILEGLGKLTKYESVEEIKNLVSIHIDTANEFVKTKQIQVEQRLHKMENEFIIKTEELAKTVKLKDKIVEAKESEINSLRGELSQLRNELTESKSKLYLEKKLYGMPNATQIREAVEHFRVIDNKIIDKMVESMTQPKEMVTESSVFNQVRNSLEKKRALPNNTLVESAVKNTTLPEAAAKQALTEGNVDPLIKQSYEEYAALAGIKK